MTWARTPETPVASSQWFLGGPNFQIFLFITFTSLTSPKDRLATRDLAQHELMGKLGILFRQAKMSHKIRWVPCDLQEEASYGAGQSLLSLCALLPRQQSPVGWACRGHEWWWHEWYLLWTVDSNELRVHVHDQVFEHLHPSGMRCLNGWRCGMDAVSIIDGYKDWYKLHGLPKFSDFTINCHLVLTSSRIEMSRAGDLWIWTP